MALMATTSLAAQGRGEIAQSEHKGIVEAIAAHDEEAADRALKEHISVAFMTRLKQDAIRREKELPRLSALLRWPARAGFCPRRMV